MIKNLKHRSVKKEMLDEPGILPGLLVKNLKELDILNRATGGHAISIQGLRQLVKDQQKTYHIVDLGCGSGDLLMAVADWARHNHFKVRLTGVDMNADAIDYLNIHCAAYPEIRGIKADYSEYLNNTRSLDIVHCSLFCHHLSDDELLGALIYFRDHVSIGFVINDLQRHWLSYCCAWFFTRLLNGTSLAKNDGPVSVLRGFKSSELAGLFKKAHISNYTIQNKWFFRYLIIGKTEKNAISAAK